MTFLPIVERELRVASRRRFTYWSRLGAAGFLLVIFGLMMVFFSLQPGMPWSLGQVTFLVLKWIAFIFAASVGIFLTSDSLSEEKREGTMGLLFLTDLRGYDVVFGKLISQSLQSFYGLFAALPILALPLMVGGVTGLEFGRTLLVLINTLFLSLAIGLFVSSFCREVIKAMNAAFFLSLFLEVGMQWLDLWLAHWQEANWHRNFSAASPGYLFYAAPNLWPQDFWLCLGAQHLLAWIFLVCACVIVPRAWQEKTTDRTSPLSRLFKMWRFGGRRGRLAFRRRWLDRQPIYWAVMRDRWLPRLVLVLTIYIALAKAWDIAVHWNAYSPNVFFFSTGFLKLVLILWIALQSCRFLLESTRNGAMELILVTPTEPREIVRSQWSALLRTFAFPFCVIILMDVWSTFETVRQLRKAAAPASMPGFDNGVYLIINLGAEILNWVFRFGALTWFGMWMGLTSQKTSMAVLKTVVFVVVLPMIGELFAQGFSIMLFVSKGGPFWIGTVVAAVIELAKNIFFIMWSRQRLLGTFRETVSEIGQAPARRRGLTPRIAPEPLEPPPLIA